jgi:hypothetical protein
MGYDRIILIEQYPLWIRRLSPDFAKRLPLISGKWVYHGVPERLVQISLDLSHLLLEGLTSEIKYRPTLNVPDGPFAHLLPPLCVYSDPDNKGKLEEKIKDYGLVGYYWQSNEATRALHSGFQKA